MAQVILSRRNKPDLYTLVDEVDLPLLSPYKWFISPDGYAWAHDYSNGWQAGMRASILMHRLILGAAKGQTVDHIDHNTLNNQAE